MELSAFQPKIKPADLPLEKLATSTSLPEKEKVAEVSRQFEAVLVRHIISEGQKPVVQSKMNKESATTGIYRDILTDQMAEAISQSRTLGLSATLTRELGQELKVNSPQTPAS
jgi:Rod binding domain-containing protein